MVTPLGIGNYRVFIMDHPGTHILAELPFSTLTFSYPLNDVGIANVNVPITVDALESNPFAAVIPILEPYVYQLAIYRNDAVPVWYGMLTDLTYTIDALAIEARDYAHMLERRFFKTGFNLTEDLALIFDSLIGDVVTTDTTFGFAAANTGVNSGIVGNRSVNVLDYNRAADAFRELASSGVDYAMFRKEMRYGGRITLPTAMCVLYDDAVTDPQLKLMGLNLSTQVVVKGGGSPPPIGIASVPGPPTGFDTHGLVQTQYTDLTVLDDTSAAAAAAVRLQFSNPTPHQLTVTLVTGAPFTLEAYLAALTPGPRIDVAIQVGYRALSAHYRLQRIDVASTDTETEKITLTLIPLVVV